MTARQQTTKPHPARLQEDPPRRRSTFPKPGSNLPYLLFRTTAKDRWLLAMLAEHRVLTAEQITRLCYGTLRRANLRLLALTELGLVDRFRLHPQHYGSTPYHYVLGPQGALLVAAAHDLTVKDFGYDRAKLLRQAYRADLPHTVGCNDLMIELACHHRTDPAHRLEAWWDQDTCERQWGEHIRPDTYLAYTGPDDVSRQPACVTAWLEYDTGSEHLDQLTEKLSGYQALTQEYGTQRIVLIQLQDPEREFRLHARIRSTHGRCPVPVATSHSPNPTGEVWQPCGVDQRMRILNLPGYFHTLGTQLSEPAEPGPRVRAPAPTPPVAFLTAHAGSPPLRRD
jgi:hypothetical protein